MVKRYTSEDQSGMGQFPCGEYVKGEDYAALEARLAEVIAAADAMRAELEFADCDREDRRERLAIMRTYDDSKGMP